MSNMGLGMTNNLPTVYSIEGSSPPENRRGVQQAHLAPKTVTLGQKQSSPMHTYFIHFQPQCLFWTCSQTTQISSPQCNNLCTGRASVKDLTVLWLCGRIVIFVLCVNNVNVALKSWNKTLTLDWIFYIFLHGRSGFQHLLEMRVLAEMWHRFFFFIWENPFLFALTVQEAIPIKSI